MSLRVLRRFVPASWIVLALLWLAESFAGATLHGPARISTLIAVASTIALAVLELVRLARAPAGAKRNRSLALIALLVAAFAVRFAGLDFELMDAPVGDEGVFHEVSEQINRGDPFPSTFNYGHLLYYLGAWAIWFFDLFPAALTRFLELFYTTVEGYGVQRILLKGVNATLSALTAGAVFGAGYRLLAGGGSPSGGETNERRALLGGVLASLLIVFSPHYNSIAHQLIADVPAAALAAFCLYFVARLLREENLGDYLLAGAASGLAAAGKYPGGVVAIAIVAVWIYWRIEKRSWSWSLLLAALASIGSLVAVMPALFVHTGAAFGGEGLDIFFGFRQYAYGGWIGVQPDSNLIWYGRELWHSFGWPALILGPIGLFFLDAGERRRWLWMAVFPAAYLVLIFSMSMVVYRNLQAALPGLAILLGVGLSATLMRVGRHGRRWALLLGLSALALPVWKTVAWDISQMRPGTRQLARLWVEEHVPEGASLIRERYAPKLDPKRYATISHRFAAWQDPDEMRSGEWEYLILAEPAYGRFVEAESLSREHEEEYRRRYRIMLGFPRVAEFRPSALRAGPVLSIFALEPDPPAFSTGRAFTAAEATFISHSDLRRDGPTSPLQFTKRWQYAVFKDFFAAGTYRVDLDMRPPPKEGYLHVVDRRNREVATYDLRETPAVALPADEKYLFRVFIAPPTRLFGLEVVAESETAAR